MCGVLDNDVLLDFRLSHTAESGFEDQLTNLLLSAWNRRYIKKRTTLNDTVTRQYNKLLADLRSGQKVYGLGDICRFFNQQYIRNEFRIAADKIIWDSQTRTGLSFTEDWTDLGWSEKRIRTLRQVHCNPHRVCTLKSRRRNFALYFTLISTVINDKNYSLSIVLTTMDQKVQKS